jgi:RHS repeat-associated protein
MEQDPETKGNGNSYTTEFRQYDPRLGRWLSLDPLMASFPNQSPYCAFDNNPVVYTDPYGLAASNPGDPPSKDGTSLGKVIEKLGDALVIALDEVIILGKADKNKNGASPKTISKDAKIIQLNEYGINPDSHYELTNSGWRETGIVWNHSVSGRALTLYFDQLKIEISKEVEMESQARERAEQAQIYNDAARKQAYWNNPFCIMYELSGFSAIPGIVNAIDEGSYWTAAGLTLIEMVPGNDAFKSADDVIKSAGRAYKNGKKITHGARSLSKKIGRGDAAYLGIKATDDEVNKIISSVMNHPDRVMKPNRNQQGQAVLDFFNPETQQGVRILVKTGEFDTFITFDPLKP